MPYDLIKNAIPIQSCLKKRENGDFLILSSPDNLNVIYLNETAKDFYLFADGILSLDSIIGKLSCVYKVEIGILKKDILHLLRDLQWKGVLKLKF